MVGIVRDSFRLWGRHS